MSMRVFVIGDPHFKTRYIEEGNLFIERCIENAKKCDPDMIVVLGDVLDSHEVVNVYAHNMAHRFISELSEISKTFILIGNHDMANPSILLNKNHIFQPYKRWKNVVIVDEPMMVSSNDITMKDEESDIESSSESESFNADVDFKFVFCPFTPPGKFISTLEPLEDWYTATCIFAHQEFAGCKMGHLVSEVGDRWSEDYPMVISGHIHDAQTIDNVHYVGSAMQHSFAESHNKHVWLVTFSHEENVIIDRIDLDLKKKKIINIDIENIETFDTSILKKFTVRLSLKGSNDQFKHFRKTKFYSRLKNLGVKFAYRPKDVKNIERRDVKKMTFLEALNIIVKNKGPDVVKEYEELFGKIADMDEGDDEEEEGDDMDDDEEDDDEEDEGEEEEGEEDM